MRHTGFNRMIVVLLGMATLSACDKTNTGATPPDAGGKIPITTKSEDARKEFLLGRALSEKLQAQESVEHFNKAVALDPNSLGRVGAPMRSNRQGIL